MPLNRIMALRLPVSMARKQRTFGPSPVCVLRNGRVSFRISVNRIRFSVPTDDYLAWRARTPKHRPWSSRVAIPAVVEATKFNPRLGPRQET